MTPGLTTRAAAAPAPPARRSGERDRPSADLPLAVLPRMLAATATVALLCLACAVLADVSVARFVVALSPRARAIASAFSALGNSGYMLGTAGALALSAFAVRRRGGRLAIPAVALLGERAAFVFATVAGSGILVQAVKHLVGRARPKLIDTLGAFHFDLLSVKASLASFPSGHTASAFGLALALGLLERRLAPLLLALAALVGVARVALGAHYPSDVVAGAALGSAVTLALAAAAARRGFAFERRDGRIALKGDGAVWPGLAGLLRGAGRHA